MRTVTALFVGLGSIGTRHLKNLANLCADRGWTLLADALRSDLSRPLRDGVAGLLHAQYTDLADAPAHYDMVFITNPTSLHADALRQVQGRGGALFIEKPIFSAEQANLRLADYLPAGQKAYVAAPMRWCGVMLALKDRLPALHPYCCLLYTSPPGVGADPRASRLPPQRGLRPGQGPGLDVYKRQHYSKSAAKIQT